MWANWPFCWNNGELGVTLTDSRAFKTRLIWMRPIKKAFLFFRLGTPVHHPEAVCAKLTTHKSASFVLAFAYIPITLRPHPLPEPADPACAETCLVGGGRGNGALCPLCGWACTVRLVNKAAGGAHSALWSFPLEPPRVRLHSCSNREQSPNPASIKSYCSFFFLCVSETASYPWVFPLILSSCSI